MVEPLTMLAIGSAVGGGISGIFEGQQEKAFQQAATEAQIQALQDQIKIQKINAARRQRQKQGGGVVASGSRGIQFSGSTVTATNQAIMEDQFKTLTNIAELKARQRLATLQADARSAAITQQQLGGLTLGAGKLAKGILETQEKEDTLRELEEIE